MFYFKQLLLFFYSWNTIYSIEVILDNCDEAGIRIYEELGYKPIFEEDLKQQDCPSYYDDSNYLSDPNRCTYKNKLYKDRETILTEACNRKCTCNILGNVSQFNCRGSVNCDQINNKTDFCCLEEVEAEKSSNISCTKFNGEAVKFMIKNTCTECICRKGDDKPMCRRKICDPEIWNQDDIKNKCAVLYSQTFSDLFKGNVDKAMCCPKRFICHEDTLDIKIFNDLDETAEQEKVKNTIKEKLCIYGGKPYTTDFVLNITYNDFPRPRSALCFCKIPPLFTCVDLSEF